MLAPVRSLDQVPHVKGWSWEVALVQKRAQWTTMLTRGKLKGLGPLGAGKG